LNSRLQGLIVPIAAIVVLLTMLGAAWPVLFGEGSPLAKYLEHRELKHSSQDAQVAAKMEARLYGEDTAQQEITPRDSSAFISRLRFTDKAAAILCLALAATLPFLSRWRRPSAWLYLLPAIWILLNAFAASLSGGKAHAELSIPAHATRFLLPVALTLLLVRPGCSKPAVNWLLRAACAMTFAVHGWEAFRLHPGFQDLIYTFGSLLGMGVPPVVCHGLLHAIGLMDLLLAIGVLLVHCPIALRWMAFWGLITAFSRPLTIGWLAWPEFAIRLANGACPWLILAVGLPALLRRRQLTDKIPNENSVSENP